MHTSISLRFILLSVILALYQSHSTQAVWNPTLQARALLNKSGIMSFFPRSEGSLPSNTTTTTTSSPPIKRPTETCDYILKNIKSKTDSKAERRAVDSHSAASSVVKSRSMRAQRRAGNPQTTQDKSNQIKPIHGPNITDSCSELEKVMKAEIEAAQQKNGISAKIAKAPSTASTK
ncbi:hypothetical protein DFH28DRAFT_929634 [Melampsora americana]|nr:hypothetical protein DFH28DRAFT_929634 [Melampsora americana]